MRPYARVRGAAPLLVAATLAVVAGCGGGGNENTGGTSTSGGAAQMTSVTVQDVAGIPSDFLNAGVKRGFFAKHNLRVNVKIAAGGAAIIPAVVSGETQFGGSNVVSALIAATKGLPIQMVAPGTFGQTSQGADWVGDPCQGRQLDPIREGPGGQDHRGQHAQERRHRDGDGGRSAPTWPRRSTYRSIPTS